MRKAIPSFPPGIQRYPNEKEEIEGKFDKEGVRKQGSKKDEEPEGAHQKLSKISGLNSFPA